MITVYRAEWSTNCERVSIALAHKGIDGVDSVVIEYADRSPVEAVSGQGLVPVIVDDDTVVSDSVAIIRHLERRKPEPRLFPADDARAAGLDVFIEWFERVFKLAPNLIEAELGRPDPDRTRIEALAGEMDARLDVFERLLGSRDFLFSDELGAADCIAYPFLKYAAGRDAGDHELFHRILDEHQRLGDSRPRLGGWIDRVGALPRAF